MQKDLAKGCNFDAHWADCGTIDALLEPSVLMKKWDLGPWLPVKEE